MPKNKTLPAIRPAAPTRIAYQRRVDALIEEMAASLEYWLRAAYRADEPATVELGQDATPLQNAFDKLARRWLRRFDTLSEQLAEWFATNVENRVDRTMQTNLRKAGFTVRFQQTKAMREAVDAVIAENVALIKSIGAQHLEGVQVALSQSIATGRDLASLTNHLTKRVGVTKRRAALIARDQINRATAVLVKTRALENGITKARWQHSAGGKTPRPEHVKASRDRLIFDMATGVDFENGEGTVWPGTAINCFPGDTLVSARSAIRRAWRSTFNGPMVYIKVGAELLEGTFNHPILTARGWVPLGLLDDGDQIVRMAHDERGVIGDDENQPETRIGHLFESSAARFGYTRRASSGFDFYGDISDGYIDEVVFPERALPDGIEAPGEENCENLVFAASDGVVMPHVFGAVDQIPPPLPSSGVGQGEAIAIAGRGHPDAHRIASAAHDAVADQDIADRTGVVSSKSQKSGDLGGAETFQIFGDDGVCEAIPINSVVDPNAPLAEMLGEVVRVAADRECRVFEFRAVRYELCGFVDKEIRDFRGHVYTLETRDGLYSASGAFVQVKNCRCVAIPVIPGFD